MDYKKIFNEEDILNEEFRDEFDTKFISFLTLIYFVLIVFTLFLYNQN